MQRFTERAHRWWLWPLVIALMTLGTGCITPSRMRATVMQPQVVDEDTLQPVAGAQVRVVYTNSIVSHSSQGFVTDAQGVARMDVPAQWVGPGGMAGNYWRQLQVSAEGYETGSFAEGPAPDGNFDYKTFRLLLTPVRPRTNVFGAVRVVGSEEDPAVPKQRNVVFDVTDGPHAYTRLRVRMSRSDAERLTQGARYYLTQSVETLQAKAAREPDEVTWSGAFLRHGTEDEPWQAPVPPSAKAPEPVTP